VPADVQPRNWTSACQLCHRIHFSGCALIKHVAGSPIATLLHVAQNEEFEGDRNMARRRLRLDLPLPFNERLTTSPKAVRAKTRAIRASLAVCWPSRKKGTASCSCTWLRKWPERGLVEWRQATNPAGRGLRLTTLRKVTTADEGS